MIQVNFDQLTYAASEQDTQCMCNVLWLVRVMFIPPLPPSSLIPFDLKRALYSDLMSQARVNRKLLESSRNMPDIFDRF
jgi:hypothetical protein